MTLNRENVFEAAAFQTPAPRAAILGAAAQFANQGWAITQEGFGRVFAGPGDDVPPRQASDWRRGDSLEGSRATVVRDGVATISVRGPLLRYASWLEYYGFSSYESIERDLDLALEDGNVRAIVLDVDSPGGLTHGSSELAEKIFASRGQKRIVAYVGALGCSAAYKLAAATSEIVCEQAAELGSIGTVCPFLDLTAYYAMNGLRVEAFVSDVSPRKWLDPTKKEGRDDLQSQVNKYGSLFVDQVARLRGVTRERVLTDFGQGGTFIGADAVTSGLADRLGNYEELVAELAATPAPSRGAGRMRSSATTTTGAASAARRSNMSDETTREMHSLVDRLPSEERQGWLAKLKARINGTTDAAATPAAAESAAPTASAAAGQSGAAPAASAVAPAPGAPAAAVSTASASDAAAPLGATAPPAAVAAPTPVDATPSETDYKAQYEALVTRQRSAIPNEAAAFADALINGGTREPKDRDDLIRSYTEAAEDDLDAPREVSFTAASETRTGSRVDRLRAAEATRPVSPFLGRRVNQRATQAVVSSAVESTAASGSTSVPTDDPSGLGKAKQDAANYLGRGQSARGNLAVVPNDGQ